MTKSPVASYRLAIHLKLRCYRGRELTALALSAGLSRAAVYHLRSHAYANVRLDTLEKLGHALGMKSAAACYRSH